MKRLSYVLLALLLVVACDTRREKETAQEANNAVIDSLRQALDESKAESNDLMETIGQIQEGFRQINEAEGRVSVASAEGESIDREAIAENMAFIQQTMRLNRELITNLQKQLRTSTQANTKMKSTMEELVASLQQQLETKQEQIEALKAELEAKDLQIAEQAQRIDNLSGDVGNLSEQNAEKARQVEEQDKALHTAYYVFGTKKELTEQRILNSGDVLRSGDFNRDYFTKIDQRVTKVIKLYSKRAKLMTNHPAGSYTLERDSQDQYVLRITQPETFWSTSKYLVIVVK